MDELFFLAILVFIGGGLGFILAIVALVKISGLKKRIRLLEKHLSNTPVSSSPPPVTTPTSRKPTPASSSLWEETRTESPKWGGWSADKPSQPRMPDRVDTPKTVTASQVSNTSFESRMGAGYMVWLGGIALIFAGFYFIKYSIESGLLTETARVMVGLLFGVGMIYSGHWVQNKDTHTRYGRIAQALAGAGIAVLYIALYAGTKLYDTLPHLIGFAGMALVTLSAVVLSVRHGPAIAVLGLVGGFFTPILLNTGEHNPAGFFSYLYILVATFLYVMRRQGWWWVSFLAVVASLGVTLLYLFDQFYSWADHVSAALFLVGVCVTSMLISLFGRGEEAQDIPVVRWMHYVGTGGSLCIIGFILLMGHMTVDWGMLWLLAAATLAISYFGRDSYKTLPWMSLILVLAVMVLWPLKHHLSMTSEWLYAYGSAIAAFGLLYAAVGYLGMATRKTPVRWAVLSGVSALAYYVLAYGMLAHYIPYMRGDLFALYEPFPLFWGMKGLALAVLALVITYRVYTKSERYATECHLTLVGVWALVTTAFLSTALAIELKREFLSIAFALEVAAIAWIYSRLRIPALPRVAELVLAGFAVVLFPQVLLLMQLTLYSLIEMRWQVQDSVPIVDWPVMQLGVPAILFIIASTWIRTHVAHRVTSILDASAVMLLVVMSYYLARHLFHPGENVLFAKAGFFERGVVTNAIFAFGAACYWCCRRYGRSVLFHCGYVLTAVAAFRLAYFDLLMDNPLWHSHVVGSVPLFNALLMTYIAGAVWLYYAIAELSFQQRNTVVKIYRGLMFMLVFAWVTFSVRQWFQGSVLNVSVHVSNAEIYSYSVAWLVLGIVMLLVGIQRSSASVRKAALALLLFTIGKVFLYDTSNLQGLWRVFSLLGLGGGLLGLGYIYSRFVVRKEE